MLYGKKSCSYQIPNYIMFGLFIKKFHYDLSFSIFGFLYLENFNYDKSTKGNFWQFFSIHNDSSSSMVFGTPVEGCPMLL